MAVIWVDKGHVERLSHDVCCGAFVCAMYRVAAVGTAGGTVGGRLVMQLAAGEESASDRQAASVNGIASTSIMT